MFAPNRKLYCILLCISILLTIACIAIPNNSPAFSIATGICCGGVASTIVAWLIDEADSKRTMNRVSLNRDILFRRLFLAFENGIQLLIVSTHEYLRDNTEHTWYEWMDAAYEVMDNNPESIMKLIHCMQVFFDEVSKQIIDMEGSIVVMLEHGIAEKKDVEALSLMSSSCELAKQELDSTRKDLQLASNLRNVYTALKLALSYSQNMSFINEMPIDNTILNMMYRRGAFTEDHDAELKNTD